MRDIQLDLNKRASKALFMLNTNQVIADKGAVEDPNAAKEEVHRPDGWIEKAPARSSPSAAIRMRPPDNRR